MIFEKNFCTGHCRAFRCNAVLGTLRSKDPLARWKTFLADRRSTFYASSCGGRSWSLCTEVPEFLNADPRSAKAFVLGSDVVFHAELKFVIAVPLLKV